MNTVIDFIEPYLNRCQNEKRLSKDTVKAYRLDLCQYRDYLYEMKEKIRKREYYLQSCLFQKNGQSRCRSGGRGIKNKGRSKFRP